MKTIPKIAVAEDHNFYRNGLCMAIKRLKFVELAFEASNGLEFLEKQRNTPVDIVLMDVIMPVLNGLDTLRQIRKEFSDVKVIVLTMLEDDETIQKFVEEGVQGYLIKNIDIEGLEMALKAVISGKVYFSEEVISFVTRKLTQKSREPRDKVELTQRELEILQLIYKGFTNKEIADRLFLSVRTITNHRYNMLQKTSTKNSAGLIAYGIRNKILN